MNPSGATRTEATVAMLRLAYPQANMSGASLAFYVSQLADIDPDVLEAAIALVIRTGGEFFPSIGTIRRAAEELSGADNLPTPTEAWGLVRKDEHLDYIGGELIDQAFKAVTSRWQMDEGNSWEQTQHRHAFMQRYGEILAEQKREKAITPEMRRLLEQAKTRAEKQIGGPA